MGSNRGNDTGIGSDPTEGTSHPVGKAVGGTAGALAGAAVGSVAGPIGTAAGAAIGAIAGWLEGKTIAEGINPDKEMEFWRNNLTKAPYYNKSKTWSDYEPAYTMGLYSYNPDSDYEDFEPELERDWERVRGRSTLDWKDARRASQDAYSRAAEMQRH